MLPAEVSPRPASTLAHSRFAVRIHVAGTVQGVGFRPFVYRLAREYGLTGWVRNEGGVTIHVEGSTDRLVRFEESLRRQAPPAAVVAAITREQAVVVHHQTFRILPGKRGGRPGAGRVPPDRVTCLACRRETADQRDRRHLHPFASCTECGPRYSILRAMPYDRPDTSMADFPLCTLCQAEYEDPEDRRFHAQPIACPDCGPRVALWDGEGGTVAAGDEALSAAADALRAGHVVALKGLGGFQLLVRADDDVAVRRLRVRKARPSKAFAVMVATVEDAARLAVMSSVEREVLCGPEGPIVLLARHEASTVLADEVAPRVGTLGLLLPTTPLHHLLLARIGLPLVATSGNRRDEPIATEEQAALRSLAGIADVFLVHDRPIVRPLDDSVVRVIDGRPVVLRSARGFAPLPLPALEGRTVPAVLALGGHQKAAIAMWTGEQAVLSQHIGDLDHPDTRRSLDEVVADLGMLFRSEPAALVVDMHPDYHTTRWAEARDVPVFAVQHHHAHAVACMAEHDLLDREVLAFTWDGTGYGLDGTLWGGEAMLARPDRFVRVASLLPFPLPGGEAAIRNPNRIAFGLLWLSRGEETLLHDDFLLDRLGLSVLEASILAAMIRRGVSTPWSSSVGRLFDAVAALALGVRSVSHEGEAAAWLEAVADPFAEPYPLPLLAAGEYTTPVGAADLPRGDWRPLLARVCDELRASTSPGAIAGRFHAALAEFGRTLSTLYEGREIVLGGGCFQNRLLAERVAGAVRETGRTVYLPGRVPPGDGGLAVGQLAVAMAKRGGESCV